MGFEPREDVTVAEFGNYRYLTVGPPLQPDVHFILGVPGPPVHDPDTAAKMSELVAKGTLSGLSFEVDDCRATYSELKDRGVEMIQEPNKVPWGRVRGTDARPTVGITVSRPEPAPRGWPDRPATARTGHRTSRCHRAS